MLNLCGLTIFLFNYEQSGVAIETKSGKLLACCKNSAHAASLAGALLAPNATTNAQRTKAVRELLRGARTHDKYKLRLLKDEDILGLTSKGRTHFGSQNEHEYLR